LWAGTMLKYRLLFGTPITVLFTGLVIFDGWLDGSLTVSAVDDKQVRATVLMILVAVIIGLGGMEFSSLAAARGLIVLNPAALIGLILLATAWYWPQVLHVSLGMYLLFIAAFTLAGIFLQQHARFGVDGVLANCGISCLMLMYLGLLAAFVLGIRIDKGLWPTLMFFFTVKSSDIGAYTFGKLFGRHKLAPRVSPGKTWEGMAGAAVAATMISLAFAGIFGIMKMWPALAFGVGIAFIGQLSDLTESMLKRDAKQKDSSSRVPGFGGILDVIDSPLFAAPFAYLFFTLVMR
jgi:phosphatidate cytidylyltransferase